MNDIAKAIDSCKYLYLHEIGELNDNELRLVIAEGISGPPLSEGALKEHLPEIQKMLSTAREIVHGPNCRRFELVWPSYVGYSVRNESYADAEPSVGDGRLFVEYTKSIYLDYLAKSTVATETYPGPFKHWSIYCLNHVVDVASTEVPFLRELPYAQPRG